MRFERKRHEGRITTSVNIVQRAVSAQVTSLIIVGEDILEYKFWYIVN